MKQISMALALYRQRGEFDGSLQSAKECLHLAEYEWTQDLVRIVHCIIASR